MYYTLKGYWSRIWTVNPYRGSTHGHPKLSLIFSDRSHCRGLPAEISILPTWIVPDRIFKYLEQELVQPSSGRRNSNTTIPHETDAIIAEHEILDAKKTKGAISPLILWSGSDWPLSRVGDVARAILSSAHEPHVCKSA